MARLLTALFFVLCMMTTVHAKVYVVCVGIADYPGSQVDLQISDNDARTIGKVFQAANNADVHLLINEGATKSALLSTMQSSFANAQSGDAVILFFSGHGTPGALICYDGKLSYNRILQVLKSCQASKKIVIADACYSGRMRTSRRHAPVNDSEDVMFFLSSRTSETSQETRFQNSLFTIYLERGLRGGADTNRDRSISARELYDFVHNGVIEASEGDQHPVMWGNFDNEMTVINW